jgi:hypothetical protein
MTRSSAAVGRCYREKMTPFALVDFCAASAAKIPIIRHPWAVCKVKNRLAVDFLEFCARSATNS